MFKTLGMFILHYVNLVRLISNHIIPEESQYVVDGIRCMHKKDDDLLTLPFLDDILTLLQVLCLRLNLDHGDYHAETYTHKGW